MAESTHDKRPTIECAENGPYIAKNLKRLEGVDGKPVATEPVMALCRCGGSDNKPFCDGTHAKIGFSGEKHAARVTDQRDTYGGSCG